MVHEPTPTDPDEGLDGDVQSVDKIGHERVLSVEEEIWERLKPLFLSSRDSFFKVMADLGLTPPHGKAVMTLSVGSAKMRDLAAEMSCDASYVTNVVDRLEELGLAKRQESAGDRRVREVVLTEAGERAAGRVERAFSDPPEVLARLSERDLVALLRILRKLGPLETSSMWGPTRH